MGALETQADYWGSFHGGIGEGPAFAAFSSSE